MANHQIPAGSYSILARLVLVCFLVSLSLVLRSEATGTAQEPMAYLPMVSASRSAPLPYPNCRFGSVALWNPIDSYDVASLNLGWYLTGAIQFPPRPNDALPVQMVRLKGRDCGYPDCPTPEYWNEATITPPLTEEGLGSVVDSNPGAVWLIGNEPDRVYGMDDVLPSQYAQAYREAYAFIKERDPSAQLAIGSVVVPTPLRLQYLDMILDEYVNRYDHFMPVDIWTTHVHMVQEVRDSWGAEIPPGIDEDTGVLFSKSQHADLGTFKQLVIDFRAWMKAHGQQDKPLYITEFGILWPDWLVDEFGDPFDEPRVIDFMYQTMTWMDDYADPSLGYPVDTHRLIQRWNWYSLDDDSVPNPNLPDHHNWNGWLFESESLNRSVFGDAFATHTNKIWPTNDLVPLRFRTSPAIPPTALPGETVSLTLEAEVYNVGNTISDRPFIVAFYEQIDDTVDLIAATTVTSPIEGCAEHVTAQALWTDISPGRHQVLVSADPTNAVHETDESNNELVGTVLIPYHRLYLPAVQSK
jgi:hypothetical protein